MRKRRPTSQTRAAEKRGWPTTDRGASTPDLSTTDLPGMDFQPHLSKGPESAIEEDREDKDKDSPSPSPERAGGVSSNGKSYTPSFIEKPLSNDDPRVDDFRSLLKIWFYDVPFDWIKRLNLADWLAWSLYGEPYEKLVEERQHWLKQGKPDPKIDGKVDEDEADLEIEKDKLGLVEHCIEMVEARAAKIFKPGRDPRVKAIRLTLDPVKVVGRPLLLYVFVWFLQRTIIARMLVKGFKTYEIGTEKCAFLPSFYFSSSPGMSDTSSACRKTGRPTATRTSLVDLCSSSTASAWACVNTLPS